MASLFLRPITGCGYLSGALWGSACCIQHVSECPSGQLSSWSIVFFIKVSLAKSNPPQSWTKCNINYLMYNSTGVPTDRDSKLDYSFYLYHIPFTRTAYLPLNMSLLKKWQTYFALVGLTAFIKDLSKYLRLHNILSNGFPKAFSTVLPQKADISLWLVSLYAHLLQAHYCTFS